jgi:hypothetical protein
MYKTGDKAPEKANYVFVRFVNTNVNCTPTNNERNIPLDKGDTFPPIRSCNAAAWYRKA